MYCNGGITTPNKGISIYRRKDLETSEDIYYDIAGNVDETIIPASQETLFGDNLDETGSKFLFITIDWAALDAIVKQIILSNYDTLSSGWIKGYGIALTKYPNALIESDDRGFLNTDNMRNMAFVPVSCKNVAANTGINDNIEITYIFKDSLDEESAQKMIKVYIRKV